MNNNYNYKLQMIRHVKNKLSVHTLKISIACEILKTIIANQVYWGIQHGYVNVM